MASIEAINEYADDMSDMTAADRDAPEFDAAPEIMEPTPEQPKKPSKRTRRKLAESSRNLDEHALGADDEADGDAETRDLVRVYLNGIGRTALLNAEEEVDLAKRIEAGLYAGELLDAYEDKEHPLRKRATSVRLKEREEFKEMLAEVEKDGEAAKKHFLEANLRLVVSLAKRYAARGDMELLDLIQEGNLGLLRAVQKFDYTLGWKFSTYATWWVRQAIQRGIADQSRTIRVPVHMHEKIVGIEKLQQAALSKNGQELTTQELAEQLKLPEKKVEELQSIKRPVSLDQLVGAEEDSTLVNFVTDKRTENEAERSVYLGMLRDEIKNTLETRIRGDHAERDRMIIMLRYGLYDGRLWTLDEIGREVGLTRERVRQVESKFVKDMRSDRPNKLRDFYED